MIALSTAVGINVLAWVAPPNSNPRGPDHG